MSVKPCAHCQNEEVEKVSAVYNRGTWTSSSYGTRHGVRWDRRGRPFVATEPFSERSKGATRLAEMLEPPTEPANVGMIMVLLFCTALLFCLWLSSALLFQNLFGWTGGCITGIVVVLFAFSMIYDPAKRVSDRQTKRYEEKHTQWKQAMDRWDNLYYCSRCDHVYDPDSGKSATARNMGSLL
ncbi:MAG TPA: hypothetical protein VKU00_31450 [Chthonomonadaceae bacterium]|nr:hypothetical protein [Chthonomonadaceae bacterium]